MYTDQFIVAAAIWTNTKFEDIEAGTLQMYGPFQTYDAALIKWRGVAQSNVDNCNHRAFITKPEMDHTVFEPCIQLGENYREILTEYHQFTDV